MKHVLAHILRSKQRYAVLPLFVCLQDDSLPPLVRLDFMRGFAFFVMAFGDLNRYVLRREPAGDVFQACINEHTREDDHHWPWFLDDLETLGWSGATTTTDALRTLWREDTHRSRLLMYDLCAIIGGADSVERMAVIEAIEETGNVIFSHTARLADAVRIATGRHLRYMGPYHFALETGHLQGSEHADLARIELSDAKRARCVESVDRVFRTFEAWSHEAAELIARAASRAPPFDTIAPPPGRYPQARP
ncbi:hypothetical protein [Burkholderia alba]|uniref:hypothetical protein n=1 Tax=Burkholderia alba TaxID=2683677 RepID=UPI002B061DA0|nr:hypothetical protein [Burkholderia alba]